MLPTQLVSYCLKLSNFELCTARLQYSNGQFSKLQSVEMYIWIFLSHRFYVNSTFSVKITFLIKKLLKSWFHRKVLSVFSTLTRHSVKKLKIYSHRKKFRQINLVFSLVPLLSRNFCQKSVRVNFPQCGNFVNFPPFQKFSWNHFTK